MLEVLEDAAAVAQKASELVHHAAIEAVTKRGRFTIALAGGSTPKALYKLLADQPGLPWANIELFFGDERAVPPDHADSNARMARETLTRMAFVPEARVHRIRAELPAPEAAANYEHTLRTFFPHVAFPQFDLILLGMGPDGHTASLFPHTAALREQQAWVAANWVEKLAAHRLTLTYPVLNHAAHVLFMIAGADKAPALKRVLEGDAAIEEIPTRGVKPAGQLTFLVDRAAAAQLSGVNQSAPA
ncbi:MAG TPA: 6-phosphogluconolactonase [Polyangiales bacterium]|nr:6-phosphogluconolactonase [Polyangiales bacterium]